MRSDAAGEEDDAESRARPPSTTGVVSTDVAVSAQSELERLRRENSLMRARLQLMEHTGGHGPCPAGPAGIVSSPPDSVHQAISTASPERDVATSSVSSPPMSPVVRLVELFEESAFLGNDKSVVLLETIVRNILHSPTEPKFRRLRSDNARLAADLFSHPAASLFLQAIGFQFDEGTATWSFPPSSSLDGLRLAESALHTVKMRDRSANEHRFAYERQRKSIGQQLRLEKLVRATQAGPVEVRRYVAHELSRNDSASSREAFRLLRTIANNLQQCPNEPRFRLLKSSNPILTTIVFPAFGALEFLVGILGFAEADVGYVIPASVAAELPVLQRTARDALDFLDDCENAQRAKEAAEREQVRSLALSESLKQRDAEKRALNHRGPSASSTSQLTPPTAAAASGRRVPIQEALARLLGADAPSGPPPCPSGGGIQTDGDARAETD